MKIPYSCSYVVAFLFCVGTFGCNPKIAPTPETATQAGEPAEAPKEAKEKQTTFPRTNVNANWSEVDGELGIDEEIDSIIQPYREKLQTVMDEEIGVAEKTIDRGRPESPLGNLIADAILLHAKYKLDPGTNFSLMNRGGIRLPELPVGPITVADIYQLVPFDNRIAILTLTGRQVESLLQSLADNQGEVLAGIAYQLKKTSEAAGGSQWTAINIMIDGKPLDADATYKLATLDYLAGIGDEFAVLQEASERKDGKLFLREIMIKHIRQMKNIPSVIDGRVTFADKPGE